MLVPLRLTPHVNYVTRNLFGNIPLKTVADRQEVLCQDETVKVPPTIFLPGQLERVTATDPGTTIELEVSTATSEILRPPPTIAHYLTDVILVDGSIYKGRFKSFISARSFFKAHSPLLEPLHLKTIGLAKRILSEARTNGHLVCRSFCNYSVSRRFQSLGDGQGAQHRQTYSRKPDCPNHPLP